MPQPTLNVEHITSYWRLKENANDALVPQGLPSYFDLQASGNAFYSGLGWLDGWCVNPWLGLETNDSTHADVPIYSTYETHLLPAGMFGTPQQDAIARDNLDLVNWVINQHYTSGQYNYGEVQSAIWKLLGYGDIIDGGDLDADGPVALADVNAIYAAAQVHEGFVPDTHEYIAVILDFGPGRQPVVIAVHPAKLGDFVWHDLNGDGIQDAGEPGIAGATVNLVRDLNEDGDFGDPGETLASTLTDANGYYAFKGLTPGLSYQVEFVKPDGFDAASPRHQGGDAAADSDGLVSAPIVLAPGAFDRTVDTGFYSHASIGDYVWNDVDRDGLQDAGESGIDGVEVRLLDSAGNVIATTLTGDDPTTAALEHGHYAFTGLAPGRSYTVQFMQPAGFSGVSPRVQGADSAFDSDGLISDAVTLRSGEFNRTLDSGFYQVAALGDFVWHDLDADGIQEAGEPGIDGALVRLLDAAGNVIATTTTGDDPHTTGVQHGYYEFTDLVPGAQYRVHFELPAGFDAASPRQLGADAGGDSDGLTSDVVVLAPNAFDRTVDAGFYQLARLGDRVWFDSDRDGQQDAGEAGVGGVTVRLIGGGADGSIASVNDNTLATTVTDANGLYSFAGLTPGVEYQVQFGTPFGYTFTTGNVGSDVTDSDADTSGRSAIVSLSSGEDNRTIDAGLVCAAPASLGDRVWYDTDRDGQQDAGEAGVCGLTVRLIGGGKDGLLATTADNTVTVTTTNSTGHYRFTGLTAGVEYQVQFSKPAGYAYTVADSGSDVTDSDANQSTGKSQIVVLGSGQNNLTIDAGIACATTGTVGDRVWFDANANCKQDAGESGIAGVRLQIKGDFNNDGVIDYTATTTTSASGAYSFSSLPAGRYTVSVDTSTLPAYLKPTFDLDGTGSAHVATATLSTGQTRADVDFGYTAAKFFVVDSACDNSFQYAAGGSNIGKFVLQGGNANPTGVAANTDGSRLWVLDQNKNVYLYRGDGSAAGVWKASDLGARPEGIAIDGQDVWIVDSAARKVFWYEDGAALGSGSATATKVFALASAITNPKGIATDGTYLWLVNSDKTDKVFRYSITEDSAGKPTGLAALGSWTLASTNATPTGLTIDPTGASKSIWVVDDGTNQVFEYANARALTSGAGPTPTKFNLATANGSPQDIADPRALLGTALVDDDSVSFPATTSLSGSAASFSESLIDPELAAAFLQRVESIAAGVAHDLGIGQESALHAALGAGDAAGALALLGISPHTVDLIA